MCGISGIIHFHNSSLEEQRLLRMQEVQKHRGPDAGQHILLAEGRVALVHNRLSIIDLSDAANQPFASDDERYQMVFNGEIYNYVEIRKTLEKEGLRFRTQSDTEVLLKAYIHYGKACLDQLDGMFAFAIYDQETQELFCARDRVGEKPFFFYKDEQRFVFASEIKTIAAAGVDLKINQETLQRFLDWKSINYNYQTHFRQIEVLPPAHAMLVQLQTGVAAPKRYWEIDLSKKRRYQKEEEYVEDFRSLFVASIKRRLRSDVELGTSLSGGLDSSSIASFVAKEFQLPLKTFSARFHDPIKDEGKWIKEVTDQYQLPNFTTYPDPNELFDLMGKLTYHQEYPLEGSSMFAQWCVMRLVQQNQIKVLIDGQGADEFLCGYKPIKYYALWDLFYEGKWGRFWKEYQKFQAHFGHAEQFGFGFIFYPILKLLGKTPAVWEFGSDLKSRMKYSVENELGQLLCSADRNAMAHSIETRLPFTNHELIEYTLSLPSEMLYREGLTKYVLRKSIKGVVPEAIYHRRDKIGFAPPQDSWMESEEGKQQIQAAQALLKEHALQLGINPWRQLAAAAFIRTFTA